MHYLHYSCKGDHSLRLCKGVPLVSHVERKISGQRWDSICYRFYFGLSLVLNLTLTQLRSIIIFKKFFLYKIAMTLALLLLLERKTVFVCILTCHFSDCSKTAYSMSYKQVTRHSTLTKEVCVFYKLPRYCWQRYQSSYLE